MLLSEPIRRGLTALFASGPEMFESRDRWRAAGFDILDRSSELMVASHRSFEGFLFKKYANGTKLSDQLDNYERRIEGSVALRKFVEERGLCRIVVPRKWLLELPSVLVVERLMILGSDESKRAYSQIDEKVLEELCVVLAKFRSFDSTVRNVPLTFDGRAAFIDTEHWDWHKRSKRKPFFVHIYRYLSSDGRKLVRKFYERSATHLAAAPVKD